MNRQSVTLRVTGFLVLLTLISFIYSGCKPPVAPIIENRQLREMGRLGDTAGTFREPRDLQLTPRGTLLVTDFRNYRIQELSLTGKPLNSWGRKGSQPGQFMDPVSAAMDSNGNIYVADTWNHRIQKFHADSGQWQADWAAGDFYAPRGITVDATDRVYVVNTSRHSIAVYEPDGKRLAVWGDGRSSLETFHDPIGIATDTSNHIYIADCGNARIKILDLDGQTVGVIPVEDWEVDGFIEGYIDVDDTGKIYVSGSHTHKICIYLQDGTLYSRFGKHGGGPELLYRPTGLAVTETGEIFITDTMNHRVVLYAKPVPLPNLKANTEIRSELISRLRWCLDGLALIIIIIWTISKLRKMTRKRRLQRKSTSPSQNLLNRYLHNPRTSFWLITSVLVALATALVLYHHTSYKLTGMIITLMATLLLIPLAVGLPYPPPSLLSRSGKHRQILRILLGAVILMTVFFRFYKLQEIPCGINNDAAWNGLYAHRILDGEPYTPFTNEAWGKSTFYFYLIALSFKLFGTSLTTLYLPCIIAGILTTIVMFLLARTLWNTQIALITSAVYGALAWTITFSRTGYRAALSPLCLALTGWLYYRAVDEKSTLKKLLYFAGTGVAIGTGLHTYFSFRGIPIMMIIIGIHTWITTRKFMRKNWWGLLTLLTTSWLVFLPLFLFGLKNPESFFGRSDFLLVTNKIRAAGSLMPVWDNLQANIQIFHFTARVGNFFDPRYAMLSFPVAFFFTIGTACAVRRFWTRSGFWIVNTLFFGFLPSLLSQADAARSILLTVPIALTTGLGITTLLQMIRIRFSIKPENKIPALTAIVLTLLIVATEYHLYFHLLARSHEAQFGYARVHTDVGEKAVELSDEYQIYIINSHFIDTPKFLTCNLPGKPFSITNEMEVDFVTDVEIRDNIIALKKQWQTNPHNLAFVLDHYEKNLKIMRILQEYFPGLQTTGFNRKPPDNLAEYYTMTLNITDAGTAYGYR